jgi:biopolymer transport protein ExbB/TolQ
MFGLLGTVTGMMKSFGALAIAGPASNELLAYGIAER